MNIPRVSLTSKCQINAENDKYGNHYEVQHVCCYALGLWLKTKLCVSGENWIIMRKSLKALKCWSKTPFVAWVRLQRFILLKWFMLLDLTNFNKTNTHLVFQKRNWREKVFTFILNVLCQIKYLLDLFAFNFEAIFYEQKQAPVKMFNCILCDSKVGFSCSWSEIPPKSFQFPFELDDLLRFSLLKFLSIQLPFNDQQRALGCDFLTLVLVYAQRLLCLGD